MNMIIKARDEIKEWFNAIFFVKMVTIYMANEVKKKKSINKS